MRKGKWIEANSSRKDRVIELYRSGLKTHEIAEKLKMSEAFVVSILESEKFI